MSLFTVRVNARKGVALILTIFSLMILGVLAAGFMVSSTTEQRASFNDSEAAAALQCADGGISWGFQALNEMQPPPCATGGSQVFGTHTYADGSVNRLTYAFADTNDCTDVYQGWGYTLQSDCTRPSGVQAAIEMKAKAHQETPACMIIPGCCVMNAYFWDFDVIEGRFHSNDAPRILNSYDFPPRGPRFTGRVTTAQDAFVCSGWDELGIGCPDGYGRFDEGYQLNVQGIDCEISYTAAELCAQAANGGYMLDKGEAWITLIPDGTVAIFVPGDAIYGVNPLSDPPGLIRDIPPSGVIALNGHGGNGYMHVKGTLLGNLTLMSGSKMYVEGDVLLAHDPRFGPSNDNLGFLAGWMQAADGNLWFPDMVVGGPDGDRLVFASYVGPHCNASILVEDYQQRDYEGVLLIYGSIMQGQLRPTQTTDGLHGYASQWILDPRACPEPPPCFPDLTREGLPMWTADKIPFTWHEVF